MTRVPTVMVEKDNKRGYSIINESDFDPKKHARYGEDAKKGGPAEIPEGWQDLSWQKRVALAAEISGSKPADVKAADEIITAEVAKRAAKE